MVLDKAVSIEIAIVLHPVERRHDLAPDCADELEIAGALVIGGRKHDEQRRAVDAAVIPAERHLIECGHLALARLVQDFAGLGVHLR